MKNQKKHLSNIVDQIITGLDNLELREAMSTFVGPPNVAAKMKTAYDYLGKRLGMMSPQEIEDLWKTHLGSIGSTKYTSKFFGPILAKEAGVVTFLTTKDDVVKTNENFYTNYKYFVPLNEENVHVLPGDFPGKTLHLLDNTESVRSYVRSPRDPNLFVSMARSGKYSNFLTIKGDPGSIEGKKLKQFAQLHAPEIINAVVADAERMFSLPEEQKLVDSLKRNLGTIPVFADSLVFGVLDIMNLGSLRNSYGSVFKVAGTALANNELLSGAVFESGESLFTIKPEVSNELESKLNEILSLKNPYLPPLIELASAQKYRSVEQTFRSDVRTFAINFGNLLSAFSKTLYGKVPPLDAMKTLLTSSILTKNDESYDSLLVNASKGFREATVENAGANFAKLITQVTDTEFRIMFLRDSFEYIQAKDDQEAHFNPVTAPSQPTILNRKTHDRIKLTVRDRYGDGYTVKQYLEVMFELMAGGTTSAGNAAYITDILPTFLELLWDDNSKEFKALNNILPIIPNIVLQLKLNDISIYPKNHLPLDIANPSGGIPSFAYYTSIRDTRPEKLFGDFGIYDPSKSPDEHEALLVSSFISADELYRKFQDCTAKFGSADDTEALLEAKRLLYLIVYSLQKGFWSCPAIANKIAGINILVAEDKDIKLNDAVQFTEEFIKDKQHQNALDLLKKMGKKS